MRLAVSPLARTHHCHRLARAQPFRAWHLKKHGETTQLDKWVVIKHGQARVRVMILQAFVQYHNTDDITRAKMDHLLRWAQAEVVRQVGDAENSPIFKHNYVRQLPYIQPAWANICARNATQSVDNLVDIQVGLDDDIGLEHGLACNAGLLANAVRGLSPWAATSLRAEQRLEFQVSRPPPAPPTTCY